MAKIKQVFTDDREIAHLWMHQTQESARNPRRNFYFDGPMIYSYGSHFPIAKLATNAILFTTRTYSITTSRHIGAVRQAIHGNDLPVFYLPDPSDAYPACFESYRKRIEDLIESIKPRTRQTTKAGILAEISSLTEQSNEFAEWAGLPDRLTLPASIEQASTDLAAVRAEQLARVERDRQHHQRVLKREHAVYRRTHAGELERWRETGDRAFLTKRVDCDGTSFDYWERLNLHAWDTALLRHNVERNEVETSMGAYVPLTHAERAYRFVAALREKHQAWQTNGHTFHIGPYPLESVDAKGNIKIGCHSITWAEISVFAAHMGWDKSSAPETLHLLIHQARGLLK